MSDSGPDAILGVDSDDASPPTIGVVVIDHDGTRAPPFNKWGGTLDASDYGGLKTAADISQSALDSEATTVIGGWYTARPTGFKVAFREALLAGKWPLI